MQYSIVAAVNRKKKQGCYIDTVSSGILQYPYESRISCLDGKTSSYQKFIILTIRVMDFLFSDAVTTDNVRTKRSSAKTTATIIVGSLLQLAVGWKLSQFS